MADISSLLSRVRSASGRLDEDTLAHIIALGEGKVLDKWDIVTGDDGSDEFQVHFSDGSWRFAEYRSRCPDVSIDAAVALVERVLPDVLYGWGWSITKDDEHFQGPTVYHASVRMLERVPVSYGARGATPPLAILAALLSALEQEDRQ